MSDKKWVEKSVSLHRTCRKVYMCVTRRRLKKLLYTVSNEGFYRRCCKGQGVRENVTLKQQFFTSEKDEEHLDLNGTLKDTRCLMSSSLRYTEDSDPVFYGPSKTKKNLREKTSDNEGTLFGCSVPRVTSRVLTSPRVRIYSRVGFHSV